jgi:hypothetical protein
MISKDNWHLSFCNSYIRRDSLTKIACPSGESEFISVFSEVQEEEEYFIDQLRTHKGHSNYNNWQYGIGTCYLFCPRFNIRYDST